LESALLIEDDTMADPNMKLAQKRLGYSFKEERFLEIALQHASTKNEGVPTNERLEFLGDAVLNLLVSWFLYEGMKDADEGQLSQRRAQIVDTKSLAALALELDLPSLLRTGKGQDLPATEKMRADLVEACIGAIFLDGGIEAAQSFVLSKILPHASPTSESGEAHDPKSKLQHYTLAKRLGLPKYRLIEAQGPGHDMRFLMEVSVGERALAKGKGTSKKIASQNAAREALRLLLEEEEKEEPAGHGAG